MEFIYMRGNEQNSRRKEVNVEINIAVLGDSGAGKSALINILRSLRDEAEGAAPVNQNLKTHFVKLYPHLENTNFKFWEIPEVGTRDYPYETFLKEIKYEMYDLYIIATCRELSKETVTLAKDLESRGKRIYFVRTKFNIEVNYRTPCAGKNRLNSSDDELKTVILNNFRHLLSELNYKDNIFIIDNHQPEKFDFAKLKNSLKSDMIKILESRLYVNRFLIPREKVSKVMDEIEFYTAWCSSQPFSQTYYVDISFPKQQENASHTFLKIKGEKASNLDMLSSDMNAGGERSALSEETLFSLNDRAKENGENVLPPLYIAEPNCIAQKEEKEYTSIDEIATLIPFLPPLAIQLI